jgi:simple sugar transport system ATP-binding protein
LLEQPTRGLDVASAGNIWQRLQARCADGTALVFTSPDLDELIEYSDSVLVFYSGRVSRAIPRAELNANRLAEMIGGIGFAENERPLPF